MSTAPNEKTNAPESIRFPISSLPNFPGRLAGFPEIVQQLEFVRGVHVLPETFMGVHHQFAGLGQALQRFTLQHQILAVAQIPVKDAGVKDEKTAVDVMCGLRFFLELYDMGILNHQFPKPSRRMNAGERGGFAVGLMKFPERADVDVADAVTVSQAEETVRFQITPGAPKPGAGHRLF